MHLWVTLVHHRERERERGREGERQRETERDRERQRETERHRERQRDTERERSRTAKLWLQYLHHIHVLKRFIIAERTSISSLHLQSTADMVNPFASSGHLNYAKSARLYVQQMMSLSEKHP